MLPASTSFTFKACLSALFAENFPKPASMPTVVHASTWPVSGLTPQTEASRCTSCAESGSSTHEEDASSDEENDSLLDDDTHYTTSRYQDGDVRGSEFALVPYFPTQEGPPLASLNFRPTFLKTWLMVACCLFYLFITGVLVYLHYGSSVDHVWHVSSVNAYLCWRYSPTAIGVVTFKLYDSTITALWRMLPYMRMADPPSGLGRGAPARVTLGAFYFPDMSANTYLTWILLVSRILMINIIPTKAALIAIEEVEDGWTLTVRTLPCFYLIAAHGIMCMVTILAFLFVSKHPTGIREDWDPVSLADVVALFYPFTRQCPVYDIYGDSRRAWVRALHNDIQRRYRLGYWKVTSPVEIKGQIMYGIGCIDTAAAHVHDDISLESRAGSIAVMHGDARLHNTSLPHDDAAEHVQELEDTDIAHRTAPSGLSAGGQDTADVDTHSYLPVSPVEVETHVEGQASSNYFPLKETTGRLTSSCCGSWPTCQHQAYRHAPFLAIPWLVFFICLAFSGTGTLTFIFTRHNFTTGWTHQLSPDCATASNHTINFGIAYWGSEGDSYCSRELLGWAALLRWLPPYLATLLMGFMNRIDIHLRWTQPFVNMYGQPGTAYNTILLDYMTISPLEVIPSALKNEHWKVLFYCVLNALSWVLPVLTAGLCTLRTVIEPSGPWLYIHFSPWVAGSCIALLVVYGTAILFAWPTLKRRLPRHVGCLFDLFRFFQNSHIRFVPVFEQAACRPGFTKEHFKARLFLREYKCQFGLVHGINGHEGLGFDITESKDGPTDFVEWFAPGQKLKKRTRYTARDDTESSLDDGIELDTIRSSSEVGSGPPYEVSRVSVDSAYDDADLGQIRRRQTFGTV